MFSNACGTLKSVSRNIFNTALVSKFSRKTATARFLQSRQISHVGLRQSAPILSSDSIKNSWIPTRHASFEADQALAEYLNTAIQDEKESIPKNKDSIAGWEMECTGCNVTLKKKQGNEVITVKFNVNHSIDSDPNDLPQEEEEEENPEDELVSKPMFNVEIAKGDSKLQITCVFSESDTVPQDDGEDSYEDIFAIEDAVLIRPGEKLSEELYNMSASTIDADLYQFLTNMLEERGIGEEFAQDLKKFSTKYEIKQYISFLEGLREFANK